MEEYFDFIPTLTDSSQIRLLIEKDAGLIEKEEKLRQCVLDWWQRTETCLIELPHHQQLIPLRIEMVSTFEASICQIELLDRFKSIGVILSWWEDVYEITADLKILASNGFKELVDSWKDTIQYDGGNIQSRLDLWASPLAERKFRELKTQFIDQLKRDPNADEVQRLVLDVLREKLMAYLERYIIEQRQLIIVIVEKWWKQYKLNWAELKQHEHADLLISQGVEIWNIWRKRCPQIRPILSNNDFSFTDLSNANFRFTDLNNTNLRNAELINADLSAAQVLGTDFTYADLTGACIQDWNINSQTKLNEVVCDYIYLKMNRKERRPSDIERCFSYGEFATLVQSSLETVDLIFQHGIDWKAFFLTFQELHQQYEAQNLSIQGIERKGGAFIVRLEVSGTANKAEIERTAKEIYEGKLALVEAQYSKDLQAKDQEISIHKNQNTSLLEVIKCMANRPINIEAKAVANHSQSSNNRNIYTDGGDYREANLSDQSTYVEGDYYNSPQARQSLAEAATWLTDKSFD